VKPTFLLVELFDIDVFDVKTPFRWAILTFVPQAPQFVGQILLFIGQHLQTNLGEPLVLQKNMRKTKLNLHQMSHSHPFYRQVPFLDKNSTWINDTYVLHFIDQKDRQILGILGNILNLSPQIPHTWAQIP
jgi:hypothetical protein